LKDGDGYLNNSQDIWLCLFSLWKLLAYHLVTERFRM